MEKFRMAEERFFLQWSLCTLEHTEDTARAIVIGHRDTLRKAKGNMY